MKESAIGYKESPPADYVSPSPVATLKLRFELIPPHGMTEVARAFTVGTAKHDAGELPEYLANPKPVSHHIGALLRHLYAYLRGEERDPDGQLHLASVAARAMMVLEIQARKPTSRP